MFDEQRKRVLAIFWAITLYVEHLGYDDPEASGPKTCSLPPQTLFGGSQELASILLTSRSHIITPVIPVINLFALSPDPPCDPETLERRP